MSNTTIVYTIHFTRGDSCVVVAHDKDVLPVLAWVSRNRPGKEVEAVGYRYAAADLINQVETETDEK